MRENGSVGNRGVNSHPTDPEIRRPRQPHQRVVGNARIEADALHSKKAWRVFRQGDALPRTPVNAERFLTSLIHQ
jgi:hypothetical protein